jgi:hypothetical protein
MKPEAGRVRKTAMWAYGYAFVPPISRHRIGPMEALLADGHEKARLAALTWEGRLINGDDITHLLVVSDRPDQDLEINHLLEAEMDRLGAPFTITPALSIGGRNTPGPAPDRMWEA